MALENMALLPAIVVFAIGLVLAPAVAQENRYSTWSNPDVAQGDDGGARKLIDELRALVDQAEAARAADSRFLGDLRDLADRYDNPWRTSLLFDDFSDGDYTAGPAWEVSAGRYWVEAGYGLRSTIEPAASPAPAAQGGSSGQDLAAAIIGSLLNQAVGQPGQQQARAPDRAALHVAQRVTNAFSVRLEMTSWKSPGRMEFLLYQGAEKGVGYRLAYTAGGTPSLELVRVSRRGVGVIDSSIEALVLEDRKLHVLEWTRVASGEMIVTLDGAEVIRARDSSFRDPFDGLQLVNMGGDFVIRSVTIHGTE